LPATKAGDIQYVPVTQEAKDILRGFDSWQRSVWVFPSLNSSTHVDARNFYRRIFLPAVRRIGLENVTWHALRHTFASRLAMAGHGDGTIAALLQHSGTALVKRYAHLSDAHLRQAMEGVSQFGRPYRQAVGSDHKTGSIADPTVTETGTAEVMRGEESS
jgi:integrase